MADTVLEGLDIGRGCGQTRASAVAPIPVAISASVVLPAGRSARRYDAAALVPDAAEDADEHAAALPPDEFPVFTLPSRVGSRLWISRWGDALLWVVPLRDIAH